MIDYQFVESYLTLSGYEIAVDSSLSDNLFSLVMEVARQELEVKNKGDEQKLYVKTELVRHLFRQGISKEKIQHLLDFIKYYIHFDKKASFGKFEEDIQLITKSRKAMGIREAILQEFMERGLEEGRVEGRVENTRFVISRARKKGMPVEEIADLVGLPMEKVEAIICELKDEK